MKKREREPDGDPDRREPRSARVKRSLWRGWIWAVPLAALAAVVYLLATELVLSGPSLTVRFPAAAGISGRDQTPVMYLGTRVGNVTDVTVSEDHRGVLVHISMNGKLAGPVRSGARFWIEEPGLASGELSGLLEGAHVAMSPGEGEPEEHFIGLLEPPIAEPEVEGTRFELRSPTAEGVQRGMRVTHRGLDAGRVLGVSLAEEPGGVVAQVFVRAPFDALVRADSRFWRCGGVGLSSGGGGFELELPSLGELLSGCVAFGAGEGGPPADEGRSFELHPSERAARRALLGPSFPVAASFPGSISGLEAGAPVELAGLRVGEVRAIELVVEPLQGEVTTPVVLSLNAARLGIDAETPEEFYDRLAEVVARGWRARLASASLLTGGRKVTLVRPDGARTGELDRFHEPPRMPTLVGADVQSILASASDAVQDVSAVAATAQEQVGPLLADVRESVDSLRSTLDALEELAAGSFERQVGLPALMDELMAAARSVRGLADYLDRHPEALLQGRSGR